MTLLELRELCNKYIDAGFSDQCVVIETENGGFPHKKMVEVTSVSPGFDWTSTYFILRLSAYVVLSNVLKQSIRSLGREVLEKLKQSTTFLKYIDNKNKENIWLEGFRYGATQFITSIEKNKE